MSSGLRISQLPKNVQDAILMVRFLWIRYLWVDALCILQDSTTDWQLESAKMGQYYRDSWLTIAAGMSDGTGGFLGKRTTHSLLHIQLKIEEARIVETIKDPTNTMYTRRRHVVEDIEHSLYLALDPPKPSTQCPIRTRGWTFQEEILPKRYLSSETAQSYLRCGTILHHETCRQENLLFAQSPFIEGERLLQGGRGWRW
jgi:Heterokaryon incompatibility protein (HET)